MKSIIIVGSGVAGVTLARQLLKTETAYQITVFEAGPDFKPGDYRISVSYTHLTLPTKA